MDEGSDIFRSIVDTATQMVVICDADRVTYVSPSGVRLMGVASADELIGHSVVDFFEVTAREEIVASIGRLMSGEVIREQFDEVHIENGSTNPLVELSLRAIRREDGVDVVVRTRDLSTERRLVNQLREREMMIESAQRLAKMGVWHDDLESGVLTWSPSTYDLFGLAPREGGLRHEDLRALIAPEDLARYDADLVRAEYDSVLVCHYRARLADGQVRWMMERGTVELGPDGRAVRRYGMVMDVTDEKAMELELMRAKEHLEEQQGFLTMAARVGRIGAWRLDVATMAMAMSDEVFRVLAITTRLVPTADQLLAIFVPEHRETLARLTTRCINEGTPFDVELRIITPSAYGLWVHVIGEAVYDESGAIVSLQGAIQDIQERRHAEELNRSLQDQLSTTLDSMSDAFFILDSDERFVYLNREAKRLLRRDNAETLGRLIWDVFPKAVGSETERQFREALSRRIPVTFEAVYPALGITAYVSAYPQPEGLAVYLRDVSIERTLEEQLRQSQRLEAIGQLTGGIAHDFNNLLTVIIGNTQLIAEKLSDHPDVRGLSDLTLQAAEQGAELNRRLLAFARRQTLNPQVIDVNRLVAGLDGLIRPLIGEQIEVEWVRAGGLWPAVADRAQLESSILNLALNARDAMPGGGRLTIETSNVRLDAAYSAANLEVRAGQYVMVAVSDTGTGIAPEVLTRVFEPFFSTKATGLGSGLGLSMVYGFAQQSGGHVKIYSELGEGTTVRVYLPRSNATPPVPAPILDATQVVGGHERILLVEDNDLVRQVVREMLSSLGYAVLSAVNGPEALELLRGEDAFDLLFTDVVMSGGMNGRELADAAKQLRPQLPVLFSSGYTDNAIIHQGRLDQGVQLLAKPYSYAELARTVRTVLDESERARS